MDGTWAIPGLDLHLELGGGGRAAALEHGLRSAITEGRLASGTRLPASRTLAADLGIARNSIADVYAQLTAEGWLEARVGAGTWVSRRAAEPTAHDTDAATAAAALLDLRGGIPDASSFPRRAWAAAARYAVLNAPAAELGLRARIAARRRCVRRLAEYLGRVRGVAATADRTDRHARVRGTPGPDVPGARGRGRRDASPSRRSATRRTARSCARRGSYPCRCGSTRPAP